MEAQGKRSKKRWSLDSNLGQPDSESPISMQAQLNRLSPEDPWRPLQVQGEVREGRSSYIPPISAQCFEVSCFIFFMKTFLLCYNLPFAYCHKKCFKVL
jgi:hypothetical protein